MTLANPLAASALPAHARRAWGVHHLDSTVADRVEAASAQDFTVYSPLPRELEHALAQPVSPVRAFTFVVSPAAWRRISLYMSYDWPVRGGRKHQVDPAYVMPFSEVLFGA